MEALLGQEKRRDRLVAVAAALASSLLAGVLITMAAAFAGELPGRLLLFGILGVGVFTAAFLSGRPKEVLLFAWVFALTYNRQFFSFEPLLGNNGSAGLYWILADVFLLALLGIWLVERYALRVVREPHGNGILLWYMPFALVCMLSIASAERMDWGMYELARTLKVAIILLYISYNFGRREWWLCVAGLAAATVAQSALGTLEVMSGRTGVLWLFGLQDRMESVPQMFKDESFYGWVRATATMAHPPNLACYLLLTLPVFLALAVTLRPPLLKAACTAVAIIGLVGLALTLSRWPAVVMMLQISALMLLLMLIHVLSPKRFIGIISVGGFLLLTSLLPFSELISDRVASDFDRSVDFRLNEYRISGEMLSDYPWLGVGLNNYSAHLAEYGSEQTWALDVEKQDIATKQLKVRYISGPLNAYLFVAAETGMLGILTFVLYLSGVVLVGAKAVHQTRGAVRVACVGMLVGVLGVYLQQMLDYSYWVDPVLYSFTLVAGMRAVAPRVFRSGEAP